MKATNWKDVREQKQAEFLVEARVGWPLIDRIGVISQRMKEQTEALLVRHAHRPIVEEPEMIEYTTGNLLSADVEALVNT